MREGVAEQAPGLGSSSGPDLATRRRGHLWERALPRILNVPSRPERAHSRFRARSPEPEARSLIQGTLPTVDFRGMKRSSTPAVVTWVDWMRSGQWEESADTAIPMLPAMASHVETWRSTPTCRRRASPTSSRRTRSSRPASSSSRTRRSARRQPRSPPSTRPSSAWVPARCETSSRLRARARCLPTRGFTAATGRDDIDHSIGTVDPSRGCLPTARTNRPTRRSLTACCTTSESSSS